MSSATSERCCWSSSRPGTSATTRGWAASDFQNSVMPFTLDGVSVMLNVNNTLRVAYVGYVSPTQVNFLMPDNAGAGNTTVQLIRGAGNTKFVAFAQFLLIFGCLVPGAYLLGIVLHMSLNGVWMAAFAYSCLAAIVMSVKFAGGSWKQIRL